MLKRINFPLYRGKSFSEGWVEGNLSIPLDHHIDGIDEVYIVSIKAYYDDPQPEFIIDEDTLEVSMPGEVDDNGHRIFKKLDLKAER